MDKTIGWQVAIFRVCLAGFDEVTDFAAILKRYEVIEKISESIDIFLFAVIFEERKKYNIDQYVA